MTAGERPAQEAALLLVDIVDSAALAARLGDGAMAAVWVAHDRLARDLVRDWRGREIDKSDGFLLMFATAADALGCAIGYHRALRGLQVPVHARAGIHVGAVSLRENTGDDIARGAKPLEVDGLAKPFAARVMGLARAGQTLLSAAARDALGAAREDGARPLVSHGHWQLKGLPEPVELFEAGDDDAPFMPPPDVTKAYRVVRQDGLWQPLRAVRHNLPAERDAFVGRHATLLALARSFDQGARLVSVLGIGGCGKTRLVTRFGRAWLGEHPGGTWFCDLAPARGLDGLLHAVAQGLEVPLGKADAVEQIGHAIAGRGACLVILDNFEQVARHAEESLGRWLDRAPEARFLVTSREVLGITGEATLALAPLPPPEAESLFALRAAAVRRGFEPGEADRKAIGSLVRLLDGLPLAIELAAARARIMAPQALLERMSERFRLLTSSSGRQDRQSTLRGAFDWSWDLLAESDRVALAQLSVFEGGFTLDAAEAVIDLTACAEVPWSVDAVHSLVDKSFVRALDGDRFDLLVSVQDYAAEHLRTAGRFPGSGSAAQDVAQARHGAWFAALGPAQAADGACADLDNLVVACRHAVRRGDCATAAGALQGAWAALKLHGPFGTGVELAAAVCAMPSLAGAAAARAHAVLGAASDASGRLRDAHQHYEAALQLARDTADRHAEAELTVQLAALHAREGRGDEAAAGHAEGLRLAREAAAPALVCAALNGLGNVDTDHGRLEAARAHYTAALAIAREIGDRRWQGALLGNLGMVQASLGRMDDSRAHLEEALGISRACGDRQREGHTQANLGLLHQIQGRGAEAVAATEAALGVARELGHVRLECIVLCNLGIALADAGDVEQAGARFDAALRVARSLGDRRSQGQILGYLGMVQARKGNFGAASTMLDDGETLLREVTDPLSLALLLCSRAEVAWLAGRTESARTTLDEADALGFQVDAGPHSELGQALSRTRSRIIGSDTTIADAADQVTRY